MAGIPKLYAGKDLAEQFGTTVDWIRQEIADAGLSWTKGPRGALFLDENELAAFLASRKQGDPEVAQVAYPVATEAQLTRDGRKPRIPSARPRRVPAQRTA